MVDSRAFRGAAPGGNVARAAAVQAPVSRGGFGPFVNRKAPAKVDDDENDLKVKPKDDDDDKTEKKGKKDSESLFTKEEKGVSDEGYVENAASAGTAGNFKPMDGSLDNAFDANADKGDSPAPNSTGKPNTPSGF